MLGRFQKQTGKTFNFSCFFIEKMKPKAEKFTFLSFFMLRKEMKPVDYRTFSTNMLILLNKEYPDSTLKENEVYSIYEIQCGGQSIDLTCFYHDYLNGTTLRNVSNKLINKIKKEI